MVPKDRQRQLLEAELVRVESTIEELARRRAQLKKQINQCCPISKLHPEILLHIFMAIFPENSFSSWGSDTPLLLGAICHGWRELAWSFPRLWSSVSFVVKHYTTIKNNLLRQWLARSRNLPLSIQFNMRKPKVDIPKERHIVWESMDIMARCSDRWEHVDLRLLVMFHPNICFFPTQLPLLISMSIYQVPTETYYKFIEGIYSQLFWNAPNLRNLHFDHIIEDCFELLMDNVVTASRRDGALLDDFLDTLEAAPYLVQYKFKIYDRLYLDPPRSIVTASHLEKLDITCASNFPGLFDYFTIPAAHELSVDFFHARFQHEGFISLLSRSGCHLTRLSLTGLTVATGLTECFQATPMLTELQLGVIEKNMAFSALTVDQFSRRALLPNLESFIYIYPNGYIDSDIDKGADPKLGALAVMARSRWDYSSRISALFEVAQLKSVYVKIQYHYLGEEDEEDTGNEDDRGSEEAAENETLEEIWPILTAYERSVTEGFERLVAEGMSVRIQSAAKRGW